MSSNETRGVTQCLLCGINCNNYHINQHSKHCVVLRQAREENNVNPDPENAELTDPLNDRFSFSDSASYSSSTESNGNNRSEGNECDGIDENMFAEEQEITVEDYINALTDESRETIMYNPAVVLRYMSWRRRKLTDQETEVLRFLRCVSFGNGLSHAHSKELLHYVRTLGGKASMLPRSVVTLWKVMQNAHCSMSDEISRRTIEVTIPLEVRSFYNFFHTKFAYIMACANKMYYFNLHFSPPC